MTKPLFLQDAYARTAKGRVVAHLEGAVILDACLFYATGGGQPGDHGQLAWEGGEMTVIDTIKAPDSQIALVAEDPEQLPPIGTEVSQSLDWARRWGHMQVHTALHLLSVVIPLPVTGGSISQNKGRLDFNMPDAPEDKAALETALQALIARDLDVTERWISDAELDAKPELVKTMSVKPPRGAGQVRLVRIGMADEQVDLQPCGGTHVAKTSEIGRVRLGKIEKKGRQNRRVYLHLDG